jgi:membrane protein DedA with SNARE-associated domain
MLDLLNELSRNALEAISQGNPAALSALFIISALTEIGIPFPFILDTILIFTGYQTGLISVEVGLIMLSLLAGRLFGASIIYWLTRVVGKVFINWIGKRYTFFQKRMDWLTNKLSRRAPIAVAITRLTPGLLTPSTVASGVINLRYLYLVIGIAISSVIADSLLLVLGFTTGRGLESIGFKPSIWFIIVALVLVIGIGWLVQRYFSHRSPK